MENPIKVKTINFSKNHWKSLFIIAAIVLTLGVGRISSDYIQLGKIELNKKNLNKPLTYNEISHAINENNEVLLLQKTVDGYEVLIVLSDSVSSGIANAFLTQKYTNAKR
jgi:hypothetical protein